jgi:transcriptional regulator with XRE-family HTH domain
MLDAKTTASTSKTKHSRAPLGAWLKSLREERGLSQRQLAEQLSLDYYTFISQLENGRGKIPSSRYMEWAHALGQEPREFVKTLLSSYEPETYDILFGEQKAN